MSTHYDSTSGGAGNDLTPNPSPKRRGEMHLKEQAENFLRLFFYFLFTALVLFWQSYLWHALKTHLMECCFADSHRALEARPALLSFHYHQL